MGPSLRSKDPSATADGSDNAKGKAHSPCRFARSVAISQVSMKASSIVFLLTLAASLAFAQQTPPPAAAAAPTEKTEKEKDAKPRVEEDGIPVTSEVVRQA